MTPDLGGQIQQAMLDRAAASAAIAWIVIAIGVGLWASEVKRRRFWIWFLLSFVTGPVAWYLIFSRLGIAVPVSVRITCPKCHKVTRSDMPRCVRCRAFIDDSSRHRAGDLARQAATMVFTARRLLGTTRRAVDAARQDPKPRSGR